MWFIDYLSVHQDHPNGGLPIFGGDLVVKSDTKTGEITKEYVEHATLEGSYTTKLVIRCDGSRVSVRGNPSRFGRPDNLFGFTRFDNCIRVYNTVLLKLGLPPFTKCTRTWWHQGPEDKRARRFSDGAVFTRIDWTRNLMVGRDNVKPFLKAMSTQTLGRSRVPHLYPDGNTLSWGKSSTWWSHKIYNKGYDLKRPTNYRPVKKTYSPGDVDYYNQLIEYCNENGFVRDEKQFNRAFLSRYNKCFYGFVKESDFDEYLGDVDRVLGRMEMETSEYITISDQLLEHGIVKSRQAANATQSFALAWLHGKDFERNSQYYVHRARLLKLGIDVAVRHDPSAQLPTIKRSREITVGVALPPSWYRMPSTEKLKLVA